MPEENKIECEFFSPKQLSIRWSVSRSSVDRIARRAGFKALYLGEGKNGSVRYSRNEVIAYEEKMRVALTA